MPIPGVPLRSTPGFSPSRAFGAEDHRFVKLALMGFQPWVTRHAKMRPESGARMKRRARTISIRYGAPDYGALSGHFELAIFRCCSEMPLYEMRFEEGGEKMPYV